MQLAASASLTPFVPPPRERELIAVIPRDDLTWRSGTSQRVLNSCFGSSCSGLAEAFVDDGTLCARFS